MVRTITRRGRTGRRRVQLTPVRLLGSRLLEVLVANKSGIHINPKNKGKFTAKAKAAGKSVQGYASQVMNDPNASPATKKQANFARNAKKFKHGKRSK